MEFIYVIVSDGLEWEDIIIVIDKHEAIKESIKHPKCRIEIFKQNQNKYYSTYNYYQNGELFITS